MKPSWIISVVARYGMPAWVAADLAFGFPALAVLPAAAAALHWLLWVAARDMRPPVPPCLTRWRPWLRRQAALQIRDGGDAPAELDTEADKRAAQSGPRPSSVRPVRNGEYGANQATQTVRPANRPPGFYACSGCGKLVPDLDACVRCVAVRVQKHVADALAASSTLDPFGKPWDEPDAPDCRCPTYHAGGHRWETKIHRGGCPAIPQLPLHILPNPFPPGTPDHNQVATHNATCRGCTLQLRIVDAPTPPACKCGHDDHDPDIGWCMTPDCLCLGAINHHEDTTRAALGLHPVNHQGSSR